MTDLFRRFASACAHVAGQPVTFLVATAAVVLWALTGPLFNFSDTWQLVINTGTTILTFLMVFVIQNTQNRDGQALQAKLDELLHAIDGARDELARIEDEDEATIEQARR